ncbi:RteC domain-containing protein [Arcticibacter tournemirensis]
MKIFTGRLMQALEVELYNLSLQQLNEYERLKAATKISKKALALLKKYISCYFFSSLEDEVLFFKHIKPLFYSKYIYYLSVYQFTIKKPTGSEDVLKEYLDSQLRDIKRFFDQNQAFYLYYRSNDSHLDNLYFTRGSSEVLSDLEDFQADEMFSTSHDYKLSKIIANEKFHEFICLQQKYANHDMVPVPQQEIIWTSNQTDLIELIYALAESGAVNNGNIEIKHLIDCFQMMFHVDLNHYYRKYTDITNRKKEKTVFLDRLKTGLIRRMEEKFEWKEPPLRRVN